MSPDNRLLIALVDPVNVTVPELLLVTTTPVVPAATVSVPSPTDRVAFTLLDPASMSATAKPGPDSTTATCSVAEKTAPGTETVGASLIDCTVSVAVSLPVEKAVAPPPAPGLTLVPANPAVWSQAR